MIVNVAPMLEGSAIEFDVKIDIPQTDVLVLRQEAAKRLNVNINRIRFIFRGKQLENGITLYEYNVQHTNKVQFILRPIDFDQPPPSPPPPLTEMESADTTLATIKSSHSSAVGSPETLTSTASIFPDPLPSAEEVLAEEDPCNVCHNNPRKKCKECSCTVCGEKNNEATLLFCEQCLYFTHLHCITPPMEQMPPEEEDWYCIDCLNDPSLVVSAGKAIDVSKGKKASQPGAKTKNWGGGNSCAGVIRRYNVVSSEHIGAIPGVFVGQSWALRTYVSAACVHRPPVAGIHGRASVGAFSLAMSGGYPEDKDEGESFTYTGAGGRDLKTGNKRVAGQSKDQTLETTNMALAMTMKEPIDLKGRVAKNWRNSTPIRVIRSKALRKHNPEYAPEEGFRYDGLYKLVRYYPDAGESGHVVWKFEMRRDDPEPAPWTVEGKRNIDELGLKIFDPDGRFPEIAAQVTPRTYTAPESLRDLAAADRINARGWDLVFNHSAPSLSDFIEYVFQDAFQCTICQEGVSYQTPTTTACGHSFCSKCLESHLSRSVTCPECRNPIENKKVTINKELKAGLSHIMHPAFSAGYLVHHFGFNTKAVPSFTVAPKSANAGSSASKAASKPKPKPALKTTVTPKVEAVANRAGVLQGPTSRIMPSKPKVANGLTQNPPTPSRAAPAPRVMPPKPKTASNQGTIQQSMALAASKSKAAPSPEHDSDSSSTSSHSSAVSSSGGNMRPTARRSTGFPPAKRMVSSLLRSTASPVARRSAPSTESGLPLARRTAGAPSGSVTGGNERLVEVRVPARRKRVKVESDSDDDFEDFQGSPSKRKDKSTKRQHTEDASDDEFHG